MSFLDCLATAVEAGKLSPKKVGEAETAYERAKENFVKSGMDESAADYAAANAALESITQLKAANRKARIFEMRKQHELYTELSVSKDPGRDLLDIAIRAQDIYTATLGQLEKIVDKTLLKYSPKFGGTVIPVDKMDDVVKGIYGQKVSPEVDAMAKTVQDYIPFERNLLNNAGASVLENKNFRLWQSQKWENVLEAGKEKWVSDHLKAVNGEDVLDWEIIRYKGAEVPVDKRQEVLEFIWERIVTTGGAKQGAESMIERLQRERFLYYKTPEAWIEMQGKYGTGNFFHQLVENMYSTARAVSLMRTFGPNPGAGKRFAEGVAANRAKELRVNSTAKEAVALDKKINTQLETFDAAYKIHAHEVNTSMGPWVQALATGNTLTTSSVLGGAIIANLSDPFYGMIIKQWNKLPWMSTIPRYFSAAVNYKNFTQQMLDDAIAYESLISTAYEGTRHNLSMEGHHFAKRVSDMQYRMQGLTAITEIGRGTAGMQLERAFATTRGMKFDDVPFVHLMRTFGVSEADWNAFRAMPLHEPKYYNFGTGKTLRPVDFYQAANTDAMRASAEKIMTFMAAVVRDGIPTPTVEARAKLGQHLPAGQLSTQFFKSMTQLMLFPVTVHYQYMRKIFQSPKYSDKLWRLGSYISVLWGAGAMVTQIKDVLNGKDPHPMDTKEFWARAFLNGGAGGLIGDMIYDSGILATTPYGANTPLGQDLSAITKFVSDARREMFAGEDRPLAKSGAQAAWGLFPFKLPGIKLVVERSIMDPILEQSDPAAYARKLRAQQEWENDQGQGTWWGVGE